MSEDVRPTEHPVDVRHQEAKQCQFAPRQVDARAVDEDFKARREPS
jgi:hypothetical protein